MFIAPIGPNPPSIIICFMCLFLCRLHQKCISSIVNPSVILFWKITSMRLRKIDDWVSFLLVSSVIASSWASSINTGLVTTVRSALFAWLCLLLVFSKLFGLIYIVDWSKVPFFGHFWWNASIACALGSGSWLRYTGSFLFYIAANASFLNLLKPYYFLRWLNRFHGNARSYRGIFFRLRRSSIVFWIPGMW